MKDKLMAGIYLSIYLVALAFSSVLRADPLVLEGSGTWDVVDGAMTGEGFIEDPDTGDFEYKVVWSDFFIPNHLYQLGGEIGWSTWGYTTIYRVTDNGDEMYTRFSGPLTGTMLEYFSYSNYSPDGLEYGVDVNMAQRLDPIGGHSNAGGYGIIQASKDQEIGPVHGTFSLTVEIAQTFSPIIENELFIHRQCN